MRTTIGRWVVVLALIGTAAAVSTATGPPAGAQTTCGAPRVTSDQPESTTRGWPLLAFDGKWGTFFVTEHVDWQYVQVDFGCVGTFTGLDRLMSYGYTAPAGGRGLQGEAVSYSVDGRTWTQLTGATTTGWERYVNYRPHAWHSLPFGRSGELRLDVPAQARYVRFHWDGEPGHFLHELYIDFTPPPPPPTVDVVLRCDAGIVACTASGSSTAGGPLTFSWQAGSGAAITSQNDGPTTSSIVGTCTGSTYSMTVTATDSSGASTTRQASPSCGTILL